MVVAFSFFSAVVEPRASCTLAGSLSYPSPIVEGFLSIIARITRQEVGKKIGLNIDYQT